MKLKIKWNETDKHGCALSCSARFYVEGHYTQGRRYILYRQDALTPEIDAHFKAIMRAKLIIDSKELEQSLTTK